MRGEFQPTRVTLLERLQDRHDQAAWQEFVGIYRNYLYVVVRNMRLSHHDAEEIVQAVFVKVWDRIQVFSYLPAKGRFRHWLCTIARNQVIDFIRTRKSVESRGGNALALSEETLPEIEVMAETEWKNYLANLALEEVRKDSSGPAFDCFLAQLKGTGVAEIAADMGITENTVYVNCNRVKTRILRKLRDLQARLD